MEERSNFLSIHACTQLEVGDSLLGPDPSGGLQLELVQEQIKNYFALKEKYLEAHSEEKRQLHLEVEQLQSDIRIWARGAANSEGFDWAVEFAEVFDDGGFDVVLANPPYVRQELIKDVKPALKKVYTDVYNGTADLYTYFYARAVQMLRPGGMLAFISSNKWFRANYGAHLRRYLAAHTNVWSITDFGELPVFQTAATFPMIFVAQKRDAGDQSVGANLVFAHNETNETNARRAGEHNAGDARRAGEHNVGEHKVRPYTNETNAINDRTVHHTIFTQVKSLGEPYPDVAALVAQHGQPLPPNAISGDTWTLTDAATAARLRRMEQAGVPLGEYVQGKIYYGVKTGFNTAFVITGAMRCVVAMHRFGDRHTALKFLCLLSLLFEKLDKRVAP